MDITLAEWSYEAPTVEPFLASVQDDTLLIHSGSRAGQREYLDIEDGGEHFVISGDQDSITVSFNGWEQSFEPEEGDSFATVLADGGLGKNVFDASTLEGVAVEFHGGPEDDRFIGGTGGVWMAGGAGNDTLDASRSMDGVEVWIEEEEGDDRITGGQGSSELIGGPGEDRIVGGDQADIINGGAGVDVLNGGGADDIYRFADGFGEDRLSDPEGVILDFSEADQGMLVTIRNQGLSQAFGTELRLNRVPVTRVVLGPGDDEILVQGLPSMTIEDTGGLETYRMTLDSQLSNQAPGMLEIMDADDAPDQFLVGFLRLIPKGGRWPCR